MPKSRKTDLEGFEEFEYDVFVCHSQSDKEVALSLAKKLRSAGLRVWFRGWSIRTSKEVEEKLERGLEKSRVLLFLMSESAFRSEWSELERQTAIFRDSGKRNRRFVPLLIENCEIKDNIRPYLFLDWRQRSNSQLSRILQACTFLPDVTETAEASGKQLRFTDYLGRSRAGETLGVAITETGQLVVSGHVDCTIRLWDVEKGECIKVLGMLAAPAYSVAISSDNKTVVAAIGDSTIRFFDLVTMKMQMLRGHNHSVLNVAITPDNSAFLSSAEDETIRVWDLKTGECRRVLLGHSGSVTGISITADGKFVYSCSEDRTIKVWEINTGKIVREFLCSQPLTSIVTTKNGQIAVFGTPTGVGILDFQREEVRFLSGHSDIVSSVAITPDERYIISGSRDRTVRAWHIDSRKCVRILEGHTGPVYGVAVASEKGVAVSSSSDGSVKIWDLEFLFNATTELEEVLYTNAKVLLVGDSGVGKTGLAYRLANDEFVETHSSDGVWATQLKLPYDPMSSATEREIWLWDFAGQSDYRLIHQLFMDETALAVLVFNPQSDNPFEGLSQWDTDLKRAARRSFRRILVAGRCDRGGPTVSKVSLEEFRTERGFAEYLQTSAKTGKGCRELRDSIIEHIDWDSIPHTASPYVFKLLKEEIVKLKDEGKVLLRMVELKQQLEIRLSPQKFTVDELRAVIGLLAGAGLVWQLEFGDFVLLHPEKINAYAAAVVRSVRAHIDEIGCIAEESVLAGDLDYQDLDRLNNTEEDIVLRAMHQTFVEHGLCLREPTDAGVKLVFPSYFRRERHELGEHPAALVTYQFCGMLDEIYATLVVRLHHTQAFDKDQLWRYAADFRTQTGKMVGLKMIRKSEGFGELTLYFDKEIPDETKATFIRYVHEHLKAKDEKVTRIRHYVCPHCNQPFQNESAVKVRLNQGKKDIICPVCENRFDLWDLIEEKFASFEFQEIVREMDEQAKNAIDNESRELILVGHAYAVAGEAGQIFRQISNSDWGIDGEIEFKDHAGNASGRRVYLQLKSGDSYLRKRKRDENEIFYLSERHAEYWISHNYDVMLVIRTSNGDIRWMNATEYLKREGVETRQIAFSGEPFTALSVTRMRDRILHHAR